jgi:hypothetical protein
MNKDRDMNQNQIIGMSSILASVIIRFKNLRISSNVINDSFYSEWKGNLQNI